VAKVIETHRRETCFLKLPFEDSGKIVAVHRLAGEGTEDRSYIEWGLAEFGNVRPPECAKLNDHPRTEFHHATAAAAFGWRETPASTLFE